jgi:hypothetical protein
MQNREAGMVIEHVDGGAYLIARAIFDNELYRHPTQYRIFDYIVGHAVHSKNGCTVAGVHVPRGSYLASYRRLAEQTAFFERNNCLKQYSISTVKRVTDELIAKGRLSKSGTDICTIWKVCNFDKYQNLSTYANNVGERGCGTPSSPKESNKIEGETEAPSVLRNGIPERLRNKKIYVNECSLLAEKAMKYLTEQGIDVSPHVLTKRMQTWVGVYEEEALKDAFSRAAGAWIDQSKTGNFLKYLEKILENDYPKMEDWGRGETAAA